MGRYVVDFATSKSPEDVERRASAFLLHEGFGQATYRDEEVWRKAKYFSMDGPQYVLITPSQGNVHLEAWVKFALSPGVQVGEIGTVAIFARIPMKRLMKRVERLARLLA